MSDEINKNIKERFRHLIGREPTEYEIFNLIAGMDMDYPESNIFDLYSQEQISKPNERRPKN